jgi:hypothetical protein
MNWNKYIVTCGDCACYFSCKKALDANQVVCDKFEVEEDDCE